MQLQNNRRRSTTVVVGVVAVALLATGCQVARAGARCAPGVGPARDATHVLFCVKGRWKRTLTIGQAAQIVLNTTPKALTPLSDSMELTVNTDSVALPLAKRLGVRLTALDGNPMVGRPISFAIERSGAAGATITGAPTTTGPDGLAQIPLRANAAAGTYTVVATSSGLQARMVVRNLPGPPASIVRTGGDGQSAQVGTAFGQPLTGRVLDALGNGVGGVTVDFDHAPGAGFEPIASVASATDGSFSTPVVAGTYSNMMAGFPPGISSVEAWAGTVHSTFTLYVLPGPLDDAVVDNAEQTTSVSTAFPLPVYVTAIDAFENPLQGIGVTFTAIAGPSGASGSPTTPSSTTNVGGQAWTSVTANGTAGTWTLRVTVTGLGSLDLTMTNTP